MAFIPRYIEKDGVRIRDPKRKFVNTETGEIVSRYQQLKSKYGVTPERHAQIRSGAVTKSGQHSSLYDRALKQFIKHHPGMKESDPEWQRIADELFAHYPNAKGTKLSKKAWLRRQRAIKRLWYDYDDILDGEDYRDYVSPEQGR